MAKKLSPDEFNRLLKRLVVEGLAEIEAETVRGALKFVIRRAVDLSPHLTGRYRGSHKPFVGTPEFADLPPAPAYSIPGDLEVDAAMAGYTPGSISGVSNDAKSRKGYVYAHNVEHLGWPGGRGPYGVYAQIHGELPGALPELTRKAVERVARRFNAA